MRPPPPPPPPRLARLLQLVLLASGVSGAHAQTSEGTTAGVVIGLIVLVGLCVASCVFTGIGIFVVCCSNRRNRTTLAASTFDFGYDPPPAAQSFTDTNGNVLQLVPVAR